MNIPSKQTLLAVVLTASTLAAVFIFIATTKNHSQDQVALIENSIAPPTQKQPIFGLPVRLTIPKINVSSLVEYVGVTAEGEMDVPKNREDVAWLRSGPRPGEIGSTVIAGHYGLNNKKTSAFDDLYKLRAGDKVYVQDDTGATITFIVRGNRRYDPKANASSVFDSTDGKSHLNLVTCEGDWNEASNGYTQRLVVFADKE